MTYRDWALRGLFIAARERDRHAWLAGALRPVANGGDTAAALAEYARRAQAIDEARKRDPF